MSRWAQSLAYLLPPGAAWPRDPQSVWMRLLAGVAANFEALHGFTDQAVAEWQPHTTHTRLEEWEQAVGLPDACSLHAPTFEARRAAVLARLRGMAGAYADSSAAAPAAIEALCATFGVVVTVHYAIPFRLGRDRLGRRFGRLSGVLFVVAAGTAGEPFRLGRNRLGGRFVARPEGLGEMACALERMVPARFELRLVFA